MGTSGSYTIHAFADADGDGRANGADNCPTVANRSQADWNDNGRGDACDRSSKTRIDGVRVRGRSLLIRGTLEPPQAPARSWIVTVRRAGKVLATARGARTSGAGRVAARLELPAGTHGRLQVKASLAAARYNRVSSRTFAVSLP